jgi:hypothetical protein
MLLLADLVRFAHPSLNVSIEISLGVYTERVAMKCGAYFSILKNLGSGSTLGSASPHSKWDLRG